MLNFLLTIFLTASGTTAFCSPFSGKNILDLLPSSQEFINWTLTDSAKIYTGEDLFTMINGGADIYIEYGFVRVAAADYSNQSHTLTAEIYEMSNESSAFGIYSVSKNRNGVIIAGECEAQLNTMYILFYKDRYFGILSSGDSAEVSTAGLKELFRLINTKINPACKKPKLVSILPAQGLRDTKLVHGYLGLSTITTFDTRDIFISKQAVIGFYDSSEVYIFYYHSEKESEDVFSTLKKSFISGERFTDFKDHLSYFEMKNRKHDTITGTVIKNHIVIRQSRYRYEDMSIFNSIRFLMMK